MPIGDPRPTIEFPDDDPYFWLEEVNDTRALHWVNAQNAKTLASFTNNPRFIADRDTLAATFGRTDNIPYAWRVGSRLYNFWTEAEHPRGVWRSTSLESYR